jgi:hypothetical protein
VPLTTDPGVQQMPSVAVDPHDANHLVVAYMDYSLLSTGYAGLGVAVSHDAGATWKYGSIPLPADFDEGAANPMVRFDGQGHVFVCFMAVTFLGPKAPLTNSNFEERGLPGIQSNNGIFVARSDDGGLDWQPPVAVVSHLYDGQDFVPFDCIPDLAIDTFRTLPNGRPNPNYGNQYVDWTRVYTDGGTDIYIAVSKDGGQTYQTQLETLPGSSSPTTIIQDPLNNGLHAVGTPGPGFGAGFQDQARLTIGPEGDIYIGNYGGGGDFTVEHSTDAGATFAIPDHSTDLRLAFGNAENTYVSELGLPTNHFRTLPTRAIVADPFRPGYVYAADALIIADRQGNQLDAADIIFARSTDHGLHWQTTFQIGSTPAHVLNDDNGGQSATGLTADEVISGQADPRLAVDAQGNISLIWYDTRHDPANHLLDVFGTTSTDGGLTFSPNFRVTSQSFDADQGKFTDATGQEDYYLGDFLGLALANNTAYAAWADTRAGNQDIFFAHYPIRPAPAPPNDRYEPNNAASQATDLGRVVERLVPKLDLPAGDEDWFRVQAAATGDFVITAESEGQVPLPRNTLQVQLWNEAGTERLAIGSDVRNAAGRVIGQSVRFPTSSGQTFLVRVVRLRSAHAARISYSLDVQSLTADLGTTVSADLTGTVTMGGELLYRLTAAADGSIEARFSQADNVQGNLSLQVLDPDTFALLSTPPRPVSVPAAEPDDSIGQANDTGLVGPGSVQLDGFVGDGAFATTSGDYDFYRLQAGASQRIDVALTDLPGSNLDGVLALYDSAGDLLTEVDNNPPGVGEFLSYTTATADTYYVVVFASTATDAPPTDPFTPGTGGGVGTTGAYSITISTQAVGAGAVEQIDVPARQGQTVLVLVSGEGDSTGDFDLGLTNLDQYSSPDNKTLSFSAGAGPSGAAVGDVNGDGVPDVVVADALTNTVSVLLGNGDGTFRAPRQFAIGSFKVPSVAGTQARLNTFRRQVALADFNHDGILDIAVTNYDSSDVSVLLGRGDGTFEAQRRFNATSAPFGLAVGDLNGDGKPDLVAIDTHAGIDSTVAELLGRGDGTFAPEQTMAAETRAGFPFSSVRVADLNNDGKADLVVSGSGFGKVTVFLGNGDGTFQPGMDYPTGSAGAGLQGGGLAITDLNGDGEPDIIVTTGQGNTVVVLLKQSDGTFTPLINAASNQSGFPAGQVPVALAVADLGSQVTQPDGSVVLGPPDGHPDLIVADSGVLVPNAIQGPPGIFLLPTVWDEQGRFAGLGAPQLLASADQPLDVVAADVNGDGVSDVVAVDETGVRVIFGQPPTIKPNDTPQTARNLGTVVHVLEPTLTIVPGHDDAYYTLTVPTEAAPGAGDEILDFSALFQAVQGAGLGMELRDAAGQLLGSGARFRVRAPQGAVLSLHIFGLTDAAGQRGAGAYTLDIDALPQVVSVQAQPLLPGAGAVPGGPTASLVITLQGDRLDPATAEDPANYRVTRLGPGGGQIIPLAAGPGSVVYDPSTNVDVASGVTYPTAVRQTVTLLFDQPLPPGSYRIDLGAGIQTAAFNGDEAGLLAGRGGHSVVSVVGGQVVAGSQFTASDLVTAGGPLGSFDIWNAGTPFLTQLHDDLGAVLDAGLTKLSDAAGVPLAVDEQIVSRFAPGLGPPDQRPTGVLVIWLDPQSFALADPGGKRVVYNLGSGAFQDDLDTAFVSVTGNVEVLVIPTRGGRYVLDVSNVPETARGGAVLFGLGGADDRVVQLTAGLRAGTRRFEFTVAFAAGSPGGPPAAAVPETGTAAGLTGEAVAAVQTLAGGPVLGGEAVSFVAELVTGRMDPAGGLGTAVQSGAAAGEMPPLSGALSEASRELARSAGGGAWGVVAGGMAMVQDTLGLFGAATPPGLGDALPVGPVAQRVAADVAAALVEAGRDSLREIGQRLRAGPPAAPGRPPQLGPMEDDEEEPDPSALPADARLPERPGESPAWLLACALVLSGGDREGARRRPKAER